METNNSATIIADVNDSNPSETAEVEATTSQPKTPIGSSLAEFMQMLEEYTPTVCFFVTN